MVKELKVEITILEILVVRVGIEPRITDSKYCNLSFQPCCLGDNENNFAEHYVQTDHTWDYVTDQQKNYCLNKVFIVYYWKNRMTCENKIHWLFKN